MRVQYIAECMACFMLFQHLMRYTEAEKAAVALGEPEKIENKLNEDQNAIHKCNVI